MIGNKPYAHAAAIASIAAGVLHAVFVSAQHVEIPPEFWFFVIIGAAQVVWGANFYFKQTPNFYFVGSTLNGGITLFWLATRILPAPFATSPEPFSFMGISIGILQLTAFIASYITMSRYHKVTPKLLALVLLFSILIGSMGYYIAKSSEALFVDVEIDGHTHGGDVEVHMHNEEGVEHHHSRNYVGNSAEECSRIQVMCVEGFRRFDDENGCGCEEI